MSLQPCSDDWVGEVTRVRTSRAECMQVCEGQLYNSRQQLLSVVFSLFLWPWELGSGRVSLATKCITVVRPGGSFRAPRVTLPWRKRPWKMSRNILGLLTRSSSHPAGQLSNTCLAMSVAESFGEKVKSCVFPLTRIRRRCTISWSLWLVMAEAGWRRQMQSRQGRTGASAAREGQSPAFDYSGENCHPAELTTK